MKLWQKYFVKEISRTLAVILGVMYLLFILIDYSLRAKIFRAVDIPFGELGVYYLLQFSKRAALLIPFALMVACIKHLTTMNTRNELMALRAAGMRLRTLMRPLIWIAASCTVLLILNFAFLYPRAVEQTDQFESKYVYRNRNAGNSMVNTLELADNTKVIYQSYDPEKGAYFDAYWLRAPDEIYHVNYLQAEQGVGEGVDHLVKNAAGQWEKKSSSSIRRFEGMQVEEHTATSPDALSYRELYHRLPTGHLHDRDAAIATHFNAKLALPWLSFLVVIATAPWCVRFSRQLPIFLIYCVSIAGFLAFLTSMDAAMILGESHVFSPYWVTWLPLLLGFGFTARRYAKI